MNRFIFIILLAGALGASPLYADQSAAPDGDRLPGASVWESQAEAEIWSHVVETGGMAVNAFCGAGTIAHAGEQRREMRAALERELSSETPAHRACFLAGMLERAAARSVESDSPDNREIVMRGRFSRGMFHLPDPGVASADKGGGRVCAILWACAPVPAGYSYHAPKSTTGKYCDDTARISAGVNLTGYSFDTVMFDAWRLYLYLWDDIPSVLNIKIIPPARLEPSPSSIFKYQHPSDRLCPPGISPFAREREERGANPRSKSHMWFRTGLKGIDVLLFQRNLDSNFHRFLRTSSWRRRRLGGGIPGNSIHFRQLINFAHHHALQGAPA